ncbi:universal stress protein [Algoriphagus sp.]|uniref:universal stress protein n=1 Tax=Algoriphagus sp. TaxID=1872435 RepID=UPI0039194061
MKKKAILATDLSQAADLLIQCSAFYKELEIEEVILFHALGVEYMNFYGYVNLDKTQKRLSELKAILEEKGFKTSIELREGLPYLELEAFTKEMDDAIIISGSSGKGFLKGMALGSTVNHLIKYTRQPLLVVRCSEVKGDSNSISPELTCSTSNQCILFPTDFSENSQHAFQFLLENVAPNAKTIDLLHVQDQHVMKYRSESEIGKFNTIDIARLAEMKKKVMAVSKASVRTEVVLGNPTKEILNRIKELNCSLVVIGKQGRGFIEEFILGSVTRKVLEESGINTLIVPNPQV